MIRPARAALLVLPWLACAAPAGPVAMTPPTTGTRALDATEQAIVRAVRSAVNQQRRKSESNSIRESRMESPAPAAGIAAAQGAVVSGQPQDGPARRPSRPLSVLELEVLALLINRPDLAATAPARRVPGLFVDQDLGGYATGLLTAV
ncbi:MAG: hypothetical protein H7138_12525, partial [Myxococcales bacterium]|nr:hypothetical protein [Myxococcales bacterium]